MAAPKALAKQAKRVGRLAARLKRIEFLISRAEDAGDDARVADLQEEREEREAEYAFRSRKIRRAAKDYPELAEALD